MPRFGTRAGGAFLVVFTSIVNPTLAWGQADSEDSAADSGEARKKALELFSQSEAAYQDGRFDEAARLLEQAYGMHKEPVLLYNLARAYEGMGELEKAVTAYRGYIEGSPEARDRGAITRRIETLEKQLADQKKLDAEKQKLAAERARRQDSPEPPPADPDRERTGRGIWPWLTAGAGVALLGSGAVVGVLSQSKRDDADADPSHASARETFRDAESLATTANVLFIVGGLVTVGGVTWILISTPSSAEQAAVGLGVGPGSLRLQGRW
jgi:tetratricopeptide (TPR) repeat protein